MTRRVLITITVIRALDAADPGLALCCGTRTRILRSSIPTAAIPKKKRERNRRRKIPLKRKPFAATRRWIYLTRTLYLHNPMDGSWCLSLHDGLLFSLLLEYKSRSMNIIPLWTRQVSNNRLSASSFGPLGILALSRDHTVHERWSRLK